MWEEFHYKYDHSVGCDPLQCENKYRKIEHNSRHSRFLSLKVSLFHSLLLNSLIISSFFSRLAFTLNLVLIYLDKVYFCNGGYAWM
jgi:hypothetical protein